MTPTAALNPTQRSRLPTERISLDTQSLQDRNEELAQRQFFHFLFALPSRIRVDAGASLIVFIARAELEIPAVGEAEVLTAGGYDRIVA